MVRLWAAGAVAAAGIVAACSAPEHKETWQPDTAWRDTASEDAESAAADTWGACGYAGTSADTDPVAVMLLQDLSGSMGVPGKWNQVRYALVSVITSLTGEGFWFGFDVFPADGGCGVSTAPVFDIDPQVDQGAAIVDALPPVGAPEGSTPLHAAMSAYLDPDHAPGFFASDAMHLLVVISDGGDTCGTPEGEFVTAQDFADVTQRLLDQGVFTVAVGFGDGIDAAGLDAIAAAGGTAVVTYLPAADADELGEALYEIAATMRQCRFSVPPDAVTDPAALTVVVDGVAVPYDRRCARGIGWTWEQGRVMLCGPVCSQVRAGKTVRVGCAP